MRKPLGKSTSQGFSPLLGVSLACHAKITLVWPSSSRNAILERMRFVRIFRLLADGASNGRSTQTSQAQDFAAICEIRPPQDGHKKDLAPPLVTARDARERRAGPEAGRVQADQREEDRLIVEAFGRALVASQVRRLSLRTLDADVLYQPRRQDPAEDATRAAGTREGGVEASVWEGLTSSRRKPGPITTNGYCLEGCSFSSPHQLAFVVMGPGSRFACPGRQV